MPDKLRRLWIRTRYWEYWPFDVLYLPVYCYWMLLSLKARSFFFFSAANPAIKNSGFVMESKKAIYDLLPAGSYPLTLLFKPDTTMDELQSALAAAGIVYPMIAKPDIGQRGMKVQLIHSQNELRAYAEAACFEFLVQDYVHFQNEIGVFYHRMPGEASGTISGVVGKEFLEVEGDGFSTLEQLLSKRRRSFLQLETLKESHHQYFRRILTKGERFVISPYGNHNRGARFIDVSHLVTPSLHTTIDKVCQLIPQFYYGRLDIRFSSWEELQRGINFSIIEVNGAGSEPTHIYDPKHSVFYAWREIIRHHRILYRISRHNIRNNDGKKMTTRDGLAMLRENRAYLKLLKMG